MKLAHKLTVAAILFGSALPVLAGDPIPGVDVNLEPTPDLRVNVGHGTAPQPAKTDTGRVTGVSTDPTDPRPSAGSLEGVSTTRKASAGAAINWGDGTPTKAANKETTPPPKSSEGTPAVYGQPVTFTAGVNKANGTADTGAKKPEGPPAAPASAKISDNESPRPVDRRTRKEAGKPAPAASFDRWGSYSTHSVASPQKDAERNPTQTSAAAREKYNAQAEAGNALAPNPAMNGPNAGLSNMGIPTTPSSPMTGPAMGTPGAMGPGGR